MIYIRTYIHTYIHNIISNSGHFDLVIKVYRKGSTYNPPRDRFPVSPRAQHTHNTHTRARAHTHTV